MFENFILIFGHDGNNQQVLFSVFEQTVCLPNILSSAFGDYDLLISIEVAILLFVHVC